MNWSQKNTNATASNSWHKMEDLKIKGNNTMQQGHQYGSKWITYTHIWRELLNALLRYGINKLEDLKCHLYCLNKAQKLKPLAKPTSRRVITHKL